MMFRQFLLLGAATVAFASVGQAQSRGQSRDDLLDALTRHIQICGEITDTQQRLSCYDRLQTQVGGVSAPAPAPAPTPTPLQAAPPPPIQMSPPPTTGSTINSAPLTPQPLGVPGGGVATLGGPSRRHRGHRSAPPQDPNAAFDPSRSTYRPPEALGPKPQPQMRRTGPRPIPYSSTPQPLVTLGASNLTYGDSRYWQVTVTLTSNTPKAVNTQAECTFINAGRPVSTDYLGPVFIQPGEQITTELIGPPTTTYRRLHQLQGREPVERRCRRPWSSCWALFLLGYLLGSIPFGLLLTRAAGLGDIRKIGSGNIGATNVLRTGHKALAAATLLLDALKGVVRGAGRPPARRDRRRSARRPARCSATCSRCGSRFKGGKGMATTLGVMWGLAWPVGAITCAAWLAVRRDVPLLLARDAAQHRWSARSPPGS